MIIGTCSLCGGAVSVPDVWYGTVPAIPTCSSCGATKDNPYGPVINMTKARPRWGNLTQRFTYDQKK